MELNDVYPLLTEYYDKAKNAPYVQKPLAWALYQVWKLADKDNNVVFVPDGIHEVDSCDFIEDGMYRNVTVQILRCKTCGRVSIGWMKQENTEDLLSDS